MIFLQSNCSDSEIFEIFFEFELRNWNRHVETATFAFDFVDLSSNELFLRIFLGTKIDADRFLNEEPIGAGENRISLQTFDRFGLFAFHFSDRLIYRLFDQLGTSIHAEQFYQNRNRQSVH